MHACTKEAIISKQQTQAHTLGICKFYPVTTRNDLGLYDKTNFIIIDFLYEIAICQIHVLYINRDEIGLSLTLSHVFRDNKNLPLYFFTVAM